MQPNNPFANFPVQQPEQKINKEKQKPSTDKQLADIVNQQKLFYSDTKECFIQIPTNNGLRLFSVDSEEFKEWLVYEYFQIYEDFPTKFSHESLRSFLSHKAKITNNKINVHNRIAHENGVIWLDLADDQNHAVSITSQGWTITSQPSVHFIKRDHQKPLPLPIKGGNLKQLRKFINVDDDVDFYLIICWLLVCFFTSISRAFLWFVGPSGVGKSFAVDTLLKLIDPTHTGGFFLLEEMKELAQVINHQVIPYFDNVSGFGKNTNNLFCITFTGGTLQKRAHYTNDKDFFLKLEKPIIVTSKGYFKTEDDFLNRTIIINFKTMTREKRVPESKLLKEFNDLQPYLLGAILDALVNVLKIIPTVDLSGYSRVADFELYGAAAAEAIGFGKENFIKAMKANYNRQKEQVVKNNSIVEALISFMDEQTHWEGYLQELLGYLKQHTSNHKELPSTPNHLSRKLKEHTNLITEQGIIIDCLGNDRGGKRYRITKSLNINENISSYVIEEATATPIDNLINMNNITHKNIVNSSDDKGNCLFDKILDELLGDGANVNDNVTEQEQPDLLHLEKHEPDQNLSETPKDNESLEPFVWPIKENPVGRYEP